MDQLRAQTARNATHQVLPALAVGALSFELILLQVFLTRIFSVTVVFHFAYVAITIAMLGVGTGGVWVARRKFTQHHRNPIRLVPTFIVIHCLLILLLVGVLTRFGMVAGEDKPINIVFPIIFLFCLLPFLFLGIAIAILFQTYRERFASLYAVDLFAAVMGCFLAGPLLSFFGGPGAVIASMSLLSLISWFSFRRIGKGATFVLPILTVLGAGILYLDFRYDVLALRRPKGETDTRVLFERWNLFSRVGIFENRNHQPWALSAKYTGPVPQMLLANIDAGASTTIARAGSKEDQEHLKWDLMAAPYSAVDGGRALILGAGGGRDVLMALIHGMETIDAVEINPILANEVMRGPLAHLSGGLYFHPKVNVFVTDGRAYVRSTKEKYELIQLTLVDSWAATASGAIALTENGLYTVEALEDYIQKLAPRGVLAISRWAGAETWRLLGMFHSAAKDLGLGQPWRHIVVMEGELTERRESRISNVLFRTIPFDETALQSLEAFARRTGFKITHHPLQPVPTAETDILRSEQPWVIAREKAHLEMRPSTDSWPFFFFFPPTSLIRAAAQNHSLLLHSPVYLVLETFLLTLLLGIVLLIIPIWNRRRLAESLDPRLSSLGIPYFACLGAAFMMLEVGMMQRLILYLGHPSYSFLVVLSGLLMGVGTGSLACNQSQWIRSRAVEIILVLGTGVGLLVFLGERPLSHLLLLTQGYPLEIRIVLIFAHVFPLGACLGVFMPLGIQQLNRAGSDKLIAWAWGINGFSSVIGSSGAAMFSLFFGDKTVFAIAGGLYVVAAILAWGAFKRKKRVKHDDAALNGEKSYQQAA